MKINGSLFRKMVVSAANALDNAKQEINDLNVFPVPDGDTGLNMSMTLSNISPSGAEGETLEDVSREVASSALRSARGNSGVILSLFFRGVSRAFKGIRKADVPEIALAFRYGTEEAYRSVSNPTEGTILTVMRCCAEAAERAAGKKYVTVTLDELFEKLDAVAKDTLEKTPDFEQVRFERDRLGKEIFGSDYVTKRIGTWFLVFPAGSEHKNCFRAAYSLQETGAREGRSVGGCCFTVDVWDLNYRAGTGVEFARSEAAMYDTAAEATDLSTEFAGCTMYELVGGSVITAGRPTFDYNGFVRFVGLPMSHPLPDGSLWSPSADELEEDDLWRLVGNGEYTMAELITWVRMEILARHGYTFSDPGQEAFLEHYGICGWYSPAEDAPEQYFTPTERQNWNLLLGLEALLDS